jgi:hypothetical protein
VVFIAEPRIQNLRYSGAHNVIFNITTFFSNTEPGAMVCHPVRQDDVGPTRAKDDAMRGEIPDQRK